MNQLSDSRDNGDVRRNQSSAESIGDLQWKRRRKWNESDNGWRSDYCKEDNRSFVQQCEVMRRCCHAISSYKLFTHVSLSQNRIIGSAFVVKLCHAASLWRLSLRLKLSCACNAVIKMLTVLLTVACCQLFLNEFVIIIIMFVFGPSIRTDGTCVIFWNYSFYFLLSFFAVLLILSSLPNKNTVYTNILS